MKDKIKLLFSDVKEIHPNILKHKVPSVVYKELSECVKYADKIRRNNFSCLLEHHNAGDNAFQVSMPSNLIDSSFLHSYLIYLGEYYRCKYENLSFKKTRRTVRLRRTENHFDGYDVWVNYAEKGSINKGHNHLGSLSGVIYYTDYKGSPIHFENNFSYKAKKGEILIFPSSMFHKVDEHKNKQTRITFAYNLYYLINKQIK
tara:strand:- start:23 stop:628 length:606 start_codon:yes stop_codon:yes gene_type:complete